MTDLLTFTVIGVVIGSAYAIAASGLVITYATSNVFNIAHGAIGMVMAFLYWELAVNRGLPKIVALVIVVGVVAPLFGAVIERVMMRPLTDASITVSLTVTVGLLVALIGLAQFLWPPMGRRVDGFFPDTNFQAGGLVVSAHQVITFLLAVAVAAGLYLLLNRTRTGVAMRAIVDNRELLALHGARPQVLSALSWALGSALAALAGILLVNELGLDYLSLTLLVINAYAAAMVGRLKHLPRTVLGALALGLLQSYFVLGLRFLPEMPGSVESLVSGLRAALPTIFLFVVMLLLPIERLRAGTVTGASLVPVPSWRRAIAAATGLLVVVGALTTVLSTPNIARLGQAVVLGAVMLSLVLLTGYGGEMSLGQLTFVGLGALVVAKVFGAVTLPALIVATLVAALAGLVVAVPALRLRGLYLGLATLAFAVAMDKLLFAHPDYGFGFGGSLLVERPAMLQSEAAFTLAVTVAFLGLAAVVLAVRKGRFGRQILALRDSEAACGTLGLSTTGTRVLLFTLSAGMAGLAGGLYAGMFVSVGSAEFEMFQSLPLLLLAVIGGITSVTGALLGGLFLGFGPSLVEVLPNVNGLLFMLVGLGAIGIGRNPNGIAAQLFEAGRHLRREPRDWPPPAPVDDDVVHEEVTVVAAS